MFPYNDSDRNVSFLDSKLNSEELDELEAILDKNENNKSEVLNMSLNIGECLPKRLINFSWIISLNLTKCYLTKLDYLPQKLVYLCLDKNHLKSIGDKKSNTVIPDSVEILSAKNNMIDFVCKLPNKLKAVDLSDNMIEKFNCAIPNSVGVAVLSKNSLSCLPIFGENITDLDISSNTIESIEGIPKSLTKLNCSDNVIKKINLLYLDKLVSLDISDNLIKNIDSVLLLPNIESICASNNYIARINFLPDRLSEINLSNNNLEEFPFDNIPMNVTYINIEKNSKLSVPDEAKRGNNFVLMYSDDIDLSFDDFHGFDYCKDDVYENKYENKYGNIYEKNYGYNDGNNSYYMGHRDDYYYGNSSYHKDDGYCNRNYDSYRNNNNYYYKNYNQYNNHNYYNHNHFSCNDSQNTIHKGRYDRSNANYIVLTKRIEI